MNVTYVIPALASPGIGTGREAERRAAPPASALPCPNTNNCNDWIGFSAILSTVQRRTVYALARNCYLLVNAHGIERVGFLTLTFARHVVSTKEAQQALHSLMTGVLKKRYPEYIIVMERMNSKRIHYHLLVAMAEDVRTGFDFDAVKGGDYRSATAYLRKEWAFWRVTAPKYGFGRTELLPIKSTAEGIAKYLGKYIGKHIIHRLPEDKGARLVRYSKGTNRVSNRFFWCTPGADMWRAKLGTFCRSLNLNSDNYQESLKDWFGKNWVYQLRPLIVAIKLPGLYPPEECCESVKAVWLTAINERARRCGDRHRKTATSRNIPPPVAHPCFVPEPKRTWVSWIERTVKDD